MRGRRVQPLYVLMIVLILAILLVAPSTIIPSAHAAGTIEVSPANGATTCPSIGGTWDGGPNTCTISSTVIVNPMILIDAGVNLVITGSGYLIASGGLENMGTIH